MAEVFVGKNFGHRLQTTKSTKILPLKNYLLYGIVFNHISTHTYFYLYIQVESLLAKHDWIARDRPYFGKANTAYDFSANEPREVEKKLAKLQEQKVPFQCCILRLP